MPLRQEHPCGGQQPRRECGPALPAEPAQRPCHGDQVEHVHLRRHHLRQPVVGQCQRLPAPGQGVRVQPLLVVQPGQAAQHERLEDPHGSRAEILLQHAQLLTSLDGTTRHAQRHGQEEPGERRRLVRRVPPLDEHLPEDHLTLRTAAELDQGGGVPGAEHQYLGPGAELLRVLDRGLVVIGRPGVVAPLLVGLAARGERLRRTPVVAEAAEDLQALVGVRLGRARPVGPIGQHVGAHLERGGQLPVESELP